MKVNKTKGLAQAVDARQQQILHSSTSICSDRHSAPNAPHPTFFSANSDFKAHPQLS